MASSDIIDVVAGQIFAFPEEAWKPEAGIDNNVYSGVGLGLSASLG